MRGLLKEEQLEMLQYLTMEVAMGRMEVVFGFTHESGGLVSVGVINE